MVVRRIRIARIIVRRIAIVVRWVKAKEDRMMMVVEEEMVVVEVPMAVNEAVMMKIAMMEIVMAEIAVAENMAAGTVPIRVSAK
jgi:hypothetical protein